MKYILIILCGLVMIGCTVVPAATATKACELLNIASNEADLAPAWYREAGDVLESCGIPDAKQDANERTCAAQKRNGYQCND